MSTKRAAVGTNMQHTLSLLKKQDTGRAPRSLYGRGPQPLAKFHTALESAVRLGKGLQARGRVAPLFKDGMRHQAFGKLSVIELASGQVVTDLHDHVIYEPELEVAAYAFNLEFRAAGDRHGLYDTPGSVGRLIESVVLTKEKQAAIGIPPGTVDICWWVGFQVDNPQTWNKILSGEYAMLSIGGDGYLEDA